MPKITIHGGPTFAGVDEPPVPLPSPPVIEPDNSPAKNPVLVPVSDPIPARAQVPVETPPETDTVIIPRRPAPRSKN